MRNTERERERETEGERELDQHRQCFKEKLIHRETRGFESLKSFLCISRPHFINTVVVVAAAALICRL